MHKYLLLLLLLPASCAIGLGQSSSAPTPAPLVIDSWPNGFVSINDGWRTAPGDNPGFANVDFDDSKWQAVKIGAPSLVGIGYRCYRLRIKLPPAHPPLGLLVVTGEGSSEVLVNGRRMGSLRIGSNLLAHYPAAHAIPLPDGDGNLTIAVRTLTYPYDFSVEGSRPSFLSARLGLRETMDLYQRDSQSMQFILSASSTAIDLALCLAAIAILCLFFHQRSGSEYLWLSLFLLLSGLSDLVFVLQHYQGGWLPYSVNALFADPLTYLLLVPQIQFTFVFVHGRVSGSWRWYQALLVASTLFAVAANWKGLGSSWYLGFEIAVETPAAVGLPIALILWFRRGNREAGWLILPSLLPGMTNSFFNLYYIDQNLLATHRLDSWSSLVQLSIWGVPYRTQALANLTFLLAIGVVLFFRYTRISQAHASSAAELKAASEMQRNLIPQALLDVREYEISTAYRPAAEVGGDFYQVIPQDHGAALAVIGDVSGKGLKAAMTGTLAIGALRSLAKAGLSPATILNRLNDELCEAGQGGFVTCLLLRLREDGSITLANAGHIPPYINGAEVPVESSLPLGLAHGIEYTETTLNLAPGDRLTLLTDGVLEARNPTTGELFGFERTASICAESAEKIALAAQAFGQEDDITVLTLTLVAEAAHA